MLCIFHVDKLFFSYGLLASMLMILSLLVTFMFLCYWILMLCVLQKKILNNFSFRCFVCNHNAIKSMYCHEGFQESRLVVATNIRTTCSFIWFVCKHVAFASAWDTHIPMILDVD